MKRLIGLLFALLVICLAGCSTVNGKARDNAPIVIEVIKFEGTGVSLEQSVKDLAKTYQESGLGLVEVKEVSAQDAAGSDTNADVILLNQRMAQNHPAIYSEITSGSYADLLPYMEADDNWNESDFVEGVLKAGRFGSSQYIIPITYVIPTLYGDNAVSEKYGLPTKEDLADYDAFWSKVDKAKLPLFAQSAYGNPVAQDATFFLSANGYPYYMGMDNDRAGMRDVYLKALAAYYQNLKTPSVQYQTTSDYTYTMNDVENEEAAFLFQNVGGGRGYLENYLSNMTVGKGSISDMLLSGSSVNPNMFCGGIPYDAEQTEEMNSAYVNMGFCVPSGSAHQQSAWNFISWCLQQNSLYRNDETRYYSFPVKKSMIAEVLSEGLEDLQYYYSEEALSCISIEKISASVANIRYAFFSDHAMKKALEEVLSASIGQNLSPEELDRNIQNISEDFVTDKLFVK